MHEFSLVRSLLRQVGDLLVEHGGVGVKAIRVEMGPLSGVERQLVELAFDQEVVMTPCRGARLVIEEVSLTAICQDCRAEFQMQGFDFVCHSCESRQIQITGGDEFRLLDVDIAVSEASRSELHQRV